MTRLIPPVWLFLAILLMMGLDRWLPVSEVVRAPYSFLGWLPVFVGIAVILWCARFFKKSETPIRPGRTPLALITEGPFAYSRNPIYLAMVAILLGLALVLGSLTAFVAPMAFFVVIACGFVRMEETMLEQTFGDAYRSYCDRVRRWL